MNEDETSLLARMSLNDAEDREMLVTGAKALIMTRMFLLRSTAGPDPIDRTRSQKRLRRIGNKNQTVEHAEEDKGLACECGVSV